MSLYYLEVAQKTARFQISQNTNHLEPFGNHTLEASAEQQSFVEKWESLFKHVQFLASDSNGMWLTFHRSQGGNIQGPW